MAARRGGACVIGCAECDHSKWDFDLALAAGVYTGALRQLVLAHKFHGDVAARRFLVSSLIETCRRREFYFAGPRAYRVITSVPQHPLKTLRRGRDPARETAESFSAQVRRDYRSLLKKTRWTAAQSSLSKADRRRNLKDAFTARRMASLPERVLIVEDVLTTAATASECARALKTAGVKEVAVLAVARSL